MTQVAFTLNGARIQATVEPRTTLADFVRRDQGLTATHLGCEHGVCGACTVYVDGAPARSCIIFAASLQDAEVRTLEGFEGDALMDKVRDAFHQEHALQCGFCTPGMLVTCRDIATRFATADPKQIRTELSGNLCRCTGYVGIVNAVQRVLREVPIELRLHGGTDTKAGVASAADSTYATPHVEYAAHDSGNVSSDRGRADAGSARGTAAVEDARAPVGSARGAAAVEQARTPVVSARGDTAHESTGAGALAGTHIAQPMHGGSRVDDSFVVQRPPSEVWELFGDTARMAECLPGFELTSEAGGEIRGNMRVSFGPIKASFASAARHERDEARHVGVLHGSGHDKRGGSRAKGQVTYRLVPEGEAASATRVEIALEFQLQGPFAQFSRSSLVRDFTRRLIAAFAANLSARLGTSSEEASPSEARAATPSLGIGAVLWSMLRDRLRSLLGRS